MGLWAGSRGAAAHGAERRQQQRHTNKHTSRHTCGDAQHHGRAARRQPGEAAALDDKLQHDCDDQQQPHDHQLLLRGVRRACGERDVSSQCASAGERGGTGGERRRAAADTALHQGACRCTQAAPTHRDVAGCAGHGGLEALWRGLWQAKGQRSSALPLRCPEGTERLLWYDQSDRGAGRLGGDTARVELSRVFVGGGCRAQPRSKRAQQSAVRR